MAPRYPRHGLAALLALSLLASGPARSAAPATFPTADAAAAALVSALKSSDQAALTRVLGADWRTYIPTEGVPREDVDAFLADYDQGHSIVEGGSRAHLSVGKFGWTLPIPLEHTSAGWSFDTKAGHEEIVGRQVGHNEMSVVQALLAYYDAQREYAASIRGPDIAPHYASRLVSSAGKHDGLYWEAAAGEPESPLGSYFASPPEGDEYFGYHYKILTRQGHSAPGGAYDYEQDGELTHGFALIAWPARYGESGVMTFEISHDGQVFQKDLGKDTDRVAHATAMFDPDSSWTDVPATP